MNTKQNLSKFLAELSDQAQKLQDLTTHVLQLGKNLQKMTGELHNYDRDPDIPEEIPANSAGKKPSLPPESLKTQIVSKEGFPPKSNIATHYPSNIINFPGSYMVSDRNRKTNIYPYDTRKNNSMGMAPVLAMPGMMVPQNITDYRPELQRDGLILLAWDKRETEAGNLYTAYWVTSTEIPRFYSSAPLSSKDFPSARPAQKSYAAEDGIEFYGQKAPSFIVHVAPELMKSNPRHGELRTAHIALLKSQGSKVDFNYKFLLKTEKTRNLPFKKSNFENHNHAGA